MEKRGGAPFRRVLRGFLAADRRACVVLTVLLCLQSLLLVCLALLTRSVIDGGLPQDAAGVLRWGGLLVLSAAIPLLFNLGRGYAERASDRAVARLRQRMVEALQKKSCAAVNSLHSGVIYDRLMRDCHVVCQRYLAVIPETAGRGVRLVGAVCALALLSGWAAAVVLLLGGAAVCAALPFREGLKRRRHRVSGAEEALSACLQEQLEQRETVQGISAGAACAGRLWERSLDWQAQRAGLRRFQLAGSTLFGVTVQLLSAGAILWGVGMVYRRAMTFGELTAVIQLLSMFRAPVSGLGGLPGRLAAIRAAEERLGRLWDLPEEPAGQPVPAGAKVRALVFEHVTFRYGEDRRAVLKDFSTRVPLDRWTCLRGPSGRGKSTLYRLILGLYEAEEGRIWLETDRGDVPCSAAARSLFGYVPQLPVLFSGTVRENLLLGRAEATEAELWSALEDCCCGFVRQLPEGLDTVLGEGGLRLSAGQRQRIALARALLAHPQVLLLDEATAALDRETERQVLHTLAARCPGAILATHRPEAAEEVAGASLILNDED